MKISIIIVVKNDPDIWDTISHLLKQVHQTDAEIIVVDASTIDIKSNHSLDASIKWIHFQNKTSKKITIPEQRNIGIKASRGDIVVFIDANCIPKHDWLSLLISPISSDNESIVAGSIWSKPKNDYHNSKNKRLLNSKYVSEAPTMNLAVKKDVFQKVGTFDETFDYGSDVDFTWRTIQYGYKLRYQPDAILYHNWGTFREEMKRAFRYGQARINLYRKNRIPFIEILKKEHISIVYPVFILLLPITIIWPYYILLLLIPILKNTNSDPFRTPLLNTAYGMGILFKLIKL